MSRTLKQVALSIFTVALYTHLFGWKWALIITITIGWHEYSHILAARFMGLKTKGFTLIPFIGGISFVADRYRSYKEQAFVAIMGPIGGGLLGVVCAIVYSFTGWNFFGVSAYAMIIMNGFNLLPLSPILDGGQLLTAVSMSFNRTLGMYLYLGITIVGSVILFFMNPFIALVLTFFGALSSLALYKNWKHYQSGRTFLCTNDYLYPPKSLSKKEMAYVLVGWFLIVTVLVATFLVLHAQHIAIGALH